MVHRRGGIQVVAGAIFIRWFPFESDDDHAVLNFQLKVFYFSPAGEGDHAHFYRVREQFADQLILFLVVAFKGEVFPEVVFADAYSLHPPAADELGPLTFVISNDFTGNGHVRARLNSALLAFSAAHTRIVAEGIRTRRF